MSAKNNTVYLAALIIASAVVKAEELDSKVLNNYNAVSAAYQYSSSALLGSDVQAHGFGLGLSTEVYKNFILGASFSEVFASNDSISGQSWNLSPTIGYAIRLMDNHLNIVPKVSYGFGHTGLDHSGLSDDTHSITGGALVSYALNNKLGIGVEYGYQSSLKDGKYFGVADAHKIAVGPTYAISDVFGVFAKATIGVPNDNRSSDSDAILGCVAGIEFHW